MATLETTAYRVKPTRQIVADTHAFTSGQTVRLKNAILTSGNVYLITASLPTNGAAPQYRIRNEKENFERMASEADLELITPSSADKNASAIEMLFTAGK